ncbi:MAG: serine protease [Marmoricola sp.]|nr:serine protease [Marmoricola sp.]
MTTSTRRRLVVGIACAATVISFTGLSQPAHAATTRHVIKGSAAPWVDDAQQLGATPARSQVEFGVLLSMTDPAGAAAALQRISTPQSPSYGHWLTNAQFDAAYAPAPSSVTAVRSWLTGQGFTIRGTLRSGMYVEVGGTAAQVESTFGSSLNQYSYQGQDVRANAQVLSLPSNVPTDVSGAIAGVVGVDEGQALKQPADTLPGPPDGARDGVAPCSTYYGQKTATAQPKAYGKHVPYVVCGYGPQQYQSAYGESGLLRNGISGHGVTVAITDAYASPTLAVDTHQYNQVHRQPQFQRGQLTQVVPPADGYGSIDDCGGNGWYGEETLDVEAVHAMAPGAKVVYVGATDCFGGLDEAWATTIDNHVADIVTNSWTDGVDDLADLGQDYIDFYQQFSLEAALTGITVNFSSGDDGDHTAGGTDLASKTAEFPADLPYVTGVGGTSVQIGRTNQWVGEHGWSNAYSQLAGTAWDPAPPGDYSSGGGGGTSQLFGEPFYQRGVVPSSLTDSDGGAPMRVVPDISMPGDPNTGMIVGETQAFPDGTYWDQYRIGGTSLSSPLMAGLLAVADQDAHHSLGFVNPLYYAMNGGRGLHDLVAPSSPLSEVRTNFVNGVDSSDGLSYELRTTDVQSSTLHDVPGYDNETGVGSPNGPSFFSIIVAKSKFAH